jgi:5-methylcytosine-specific restriction enzyme subunit McrC
MTVLRMVESRDAVFPEASLSEAEALGLGSIRRGPTAPFTVTAPSAFNERKWVLRSEGWVGYVPLGAGRGLSIEPKVGIEGLLRLLEIAYRLDPLVLEGRYEAVSIPELYGRVASLLAQRLLDRARRGLYRTYVRVEDDLPCVRGALDLRTCMRRPVLTRFPCQFEEHAADNEENRIVAWGLRCALASGLCGSTVLPIVRRALHTLQGALEIVPVQSSACQARVYNRLSVDYAPMHALARFLIEGAGPTHVVGDRAMVPFLLEMAPLFESFVSEWLRASLPTRFCLLDQYTLRLGTLGSLVMRMDLVVSDRSFGRPVIVLDVKYKDSDTPSNADVYQVVAYANALGVRDAWLVYPRPVAQPFDVSVRDIRVRTVAFSLEEHPATAGARFLEVLGLRPSDPALCALA